MTGDRHPTSSRVPALARLAWAIASLIVVEAVVCGLALLPVIALWLPAMATSAENMVLRVVVVSLAIVPSYALFALALMFVSALATRVTRWRTEPDMEMPLRQLEWPLLDWVRYMVNIHVVRLFAGTLFRGTPIWSAYLRLSGGRIGRRVYVNTLALSDHNLLELGDDVVIGEGVHMSGHTVEAGVVRTGRVAVGRNVTIGLGSIVGIGVTIGPETQIGAMSLVPKNTELRGGAVYAGVPAIPIAGRSTRDG